ncbi:hypothetical protein V6N13_038268 [Hibiscus sabdariffa]
MLLAITCEVVIVHLKLLASALIHVEVHSQSYVFISSIFESFTLCYEIFSSMPRSSVYTDFYENILDNAGSVIGSKYNMIDASSNYT